MNTRKTETIFGIGWPGNTKGYACVLELDGDIIKLVHEIEGDNMADLITKCARFKRDHREHYPIKGYVGRRGQAETAYLKEYNRNTMNEFIVFGEAPNIESTGRIYYHLNIILDLVRNDNKRLYFSDKSGVLTQVFEAKDKDGIQDIKDVDYPAIAALGYGVAYLSLRMGKLRRRNRVNRRSNYKTV